MIQPFFLLDTIVGVVVVLRGNHPWYKIKLSNVSLFFWTERQIYNPASALLLSFVLKIKE